MLLSPKFIFNDCLGWRFDVLSRKAIASIVGRGEPCVRGWERNKDFPDEAIEKITEHLKNVGIKGFEEDISIFSDGFPRIGFHSFEWKKMCLGFLSHDGFPYRKAFEALYSLTTRQVELYQSIHAMDPECMFEAYKSALQGEFYPMFILPDKLTEKIKTSADWKDLDSIFSWFRLETLIYFTALAEAEYLREYYNIHESKICEWFLSKNKGVKTMPPLKAFFDEFFDRLVSRKHFPSLDNIAERLTVVGRSDRNNVVHVTNIEKSSAWREIKRAKYEGKTPTFETFRAWIDALFPKIEEATKDAIELEKQLIIDVFGAARILDGVFKKAMKELPEKEVYEQFQHYHNWYEFHLQSISPEGNS